MQFAQSIVQFFREGGFGIWPTLLLGVTALSLAIHHALTPRPAHLPLLIGLGLATLAAGALGTCMGFMATFKYIQHVPQAEQGTIAMLGISESLTNVVLALIVCVLLPLLGGIGSWRARLGQPALEAR